MSAFILLTSLLFAYETILFHSCLQNHKHYYLCMKTLVQVPVKDDYIDSFKEKCTQLYGCVLCILYLVVCAFGVIAKKPLPYLRS